MPHAPLRTLRYAMAWLGPGTDLAEEELTLDRAGVAVPATLVRPRGGTSPRPAWIALHGITRPGRRHHQLMRFSRALASTGAVVIVPDVPEWRALDLAPALAAPTVRAAVAALRARADVGESAIAVVGFSFGAPHAIGAVGMPDLEAELAGAVGFGSYCDIGRTIRFMLTGRHEWAGVDHRATPDPYGRWIVGANYLTRVPGHEDAEDVARALRTLAAHAGDVGDAAWDPAYDPVKADLRETVAAGRRALFDLFAPPSGREPAPDLAEPMAVELAHAAVRAEPEIDPAGVLARVSLPVHLLHGRHDQLIPFSEGLRTHAALPAETWSRVTVTRLFGHAGGEPFPGLVRGMREAVSFVQALSGLLAAV